MARLTRDSNEEPLMQVYVAIAKKSLTYYGYRIAIS